MKVKLNAVCSSHLWDYDKSYVTFLSGIVKLLCPVLMSFTSIKMTDDNKNFNFTRR